MHLLTHSLLTFLGIVCIGAESMPLFAKPSEQKQEKRSELKPDNKQRSPRQLDPFLPEWRPYAQSALHTWWASSWEHPPNHHPNSHKHFYFPGHEPHHQAIYVAANLGAVHVASLSGHFEFVIADNLGPVGTPLVLMPQVAPVEPQPLQKPSFLARRNSNSDGTPRIW